MSAVGRSLQRAKQQRLRQAKERYRHLVQTERELALQATEEAEFREAASNEKGKLKSIWDTNDLQRFLEIADEREEGYNAQHNVQLIVGGKKFIAQGDKVVPHCDGRDWIRLSEELPVPRRPAWGYDMTALHVQQQEKKEFLTWRRRLAQIEEKHKVLMTPYEKNLEVWRQLWRVVERADVVLEIVDARNPLVFRSKDFEDYVRSSVNAAGKPKKAVVLLNKADLLTEAQRRVWAAYFHQRNDQFLFFSARPLDDTQAGTESKSLKNGNTDGSIGGNEFDVDDRGEAESDYDDEEGEEGEEDDDDSDAATTAQSRAHRTRHRKKVLRAPVVVQHPFELVELRHQAKMEMRARKIAPQQRAPLIPTEEESERDARVSRLKATGAGNENSLLAESWRVLSPLELLDCLALLRESQGITDPQTPLMVGLVGYPNVGKSSTINALLGAKKVVVSATPGKTKHFQTLTIPNERRVMLCDCPGLVFPSFASTREHMVCDGVLPIDTVTDYTSPVAVLCQRIPRVVLEQRFNVSLHPNDDIDDSTSPAERLMNAVARRRGFMTDHDKPNRSRAAKDLLKLYVDGALVFVCPPPTYTAPEPNHGEEWHNPREQMTAVEKRAGAPDPGQTALAVHVNANADDYDEDEAWEDISSAEEARALSDEDRSNCGDHADRSLGRRRSAEEVEGYGPEDMEFFVQPKEETRRMLVKVDEAFNSEANAHRVMQALSAGGKKRRKKRTNHQIEPDMYTFVNEDGEVELIVDDDDGVVELGTGKDFVRNKPKQKSKRAARRELKRMGVSGPVNPTTRKYGVAGYGDPKSQ